MTKPLRKAIEIIAECLPMPGKVLEIGALQTKNQRRLANRRPLFFKADYIGVDIREGHGVDVVANGESLPFGKEQFDLVLCLETLEHARKPWLITAEILRVLKNDGVVIISSQQNFPVHKHPSDYFRFTPYGLASLFEGLGDLLLFSISPPFADEVNLNPQHVVLIGWKERKAGQKKRLKQLLEVKVEEISLHKPYRHRFKDCLKFFRRGLDELRYRETVAFFAKDSR